MTANIYQAPLMYIPECFTYIDLLNPYKNPISISLSYYSDEKAEAHKH